MAAVVGAESAHADSGTITSRYTKLDDCDEVASGDVEAGEDWIFHRCKGFGGTPVWLAYTDSVRSHIGFGREANVTGPFYSVRNEAWPIEWRGHLRGGRFEPFAVIVRMPLVDDEEASDLIVFRLRPDGTSCVVNSVSGSNQEAREIADAALTKFKCVQEPQLP